MAAKCSHEDTRLTCIDCSQPICGACLVQCPVGFRCKSCVGVGSSQSQAAAPSFLVARTLGMAALVGFAGGWIIQFINVPFFSCIIAYFLGLFAGRWLAGRIDYHALAARVPKLIVGGLLIGMCFTPLIIFPFAAVSIIFGSFMTPGLPLFQNITDIVNALFCPVLYAVGVLRPTIWGSR